MTSKTVWLYVTRDACHTVCDLTASRASVQARRLKTCQERPRWLFNFNLYFNSIHFCFLFVSTNPFKQITKKTCIRKLILDTILDTGQYLITCCGILFGSCLSRLAAYICSLYCLSGAMSSKWWIRGPHSTDVSGIMKRPSILNSCTRTQEHHVGLLFPNVTRP